MQMYQKNETLFGHRGLSLPDTYNATIDWKLNESFTLTFDYPLLSLNGAEIQSELIVKAPTPEGDNLFRIQNCVKSMGVITVTAYQVFWDLSFNWIDDINIVGDNGTEAVSHIMNNTQYPHQFTYTSSLTNTANVQIVRMSAINALMGTDDNTFINRYGGEFDWQGFTFNVVEQLGKNRGVIFRNKKNLTGYKETVDYTNVVTRIVPEGYNGLFLPEKYVDSPLIANYQSPKVSMIGFDDIKAIETAADGSVTSDDDAVDVDTAYQMLRDAANAKYSEDHVDEPTTTIELNVVMLENTEEYKDTSIFSRVYPGDTARFIHDEDGIDTTARLTGYTWDPVVSEYLTQTYSSSPRTTDDLGSKLSSINGTLDKLTGKIVSVDNGVVGRAQSVFSDTLKAGFGGHVFVDPDRMLIMDTDNQTTAQKVWQWNLNGLGYSSTGVSGDYTVGMTMDGHINGKMITAQSITADQFATDAIEVGINSMGNTIYITPWQLEFDRDNETQLTLDETGLQVYSGGWSVGLIDGHTWPGDPLRNMPADPNSHGIGFRLDEYGGFMDWERWDDDAGDYVPKLSWLPDPFSKMDSAVATALDVDGTPAFFFDDDVYMAKSFSCYNIHCWASNLSQLIFSNISNDVSLESQGTVQITGWENLAFYTWNDAVFHFNAQDGSSNLAISIKDLNDKITTVNDNEINIGISLSNMQGNIDGLRSDTETNLTNFQNDTNNYVQQVDQTANDAYNLANEAKQQADTAYNMADMNNGIPFTVEDEQYLDSLMMHVMQVGWW